MPRCATGMGGREGATRWVGAQLLRSESQPNRRVIVGTCERC
jgi:hypothetical protein